MDSRLPLQWYVLMQVPLAGALDTSGKRKPMVANSLLDRFLANEKGTLIFFSSFRLLSSFSSRSDGLEVGCNLSS